MQQTRDANSEFRQRARDEREQGTDRQTESRQSTINGSAADKRHESEHDESDLAEVHFSVVEQVHDAAGGANHNLNTWHHISEKKVTGKDVTATTIETEKQ